MTGEWVVVAGAAGDIGQAVCARAKEAGYKVFALDNVAPARFVDSLLEVDLAALTSRQIAAVAGETSHLAVQHMFAVVGGALADELSNPDPARVSLTVARDTFELNIFSVIGLVEALLPAIRRGEPPHRSITAVSSINALGGYGAPAYSAAKAALTGLVLSLADLLAAEEIRVNAVALGTTHTANLCRLLAKQGRDIASVLEGHRFPRGSTLSAEEAGDAIFDVGTRLKIATGQIVIADAGQSIRRP